MIRIRVYLSPNTIKVPEAASCWFFFKVKPSLTGATFLWYLPSFKLYLDGCWWFWWLFVIHYCCCWIAEWHDFIMVLAASASLLTCCINHIFDSAHFFKKQGNFLLNNIDQFCCRYLQLGTLMQLIVIGRLLQRKWSCNTLSSLIYYYFYVLIKCIWLLISQKVTLDIQQCNKTAEIYVKQASVKPIYNNC